MKPTDGECSSGVQLLPGTCEDLGATHSNPLSKRDQHRKNILGNIFLFWFGLVFGFVVLFVRVLGGSC